MRRKRRQYSKFLRPCQFCRQSKFQRDQMIKRLLPFGCAAFLFWNFACSKTQTSHTQIPSPEVQGTVPADTADVTPIVPQGPVAGSVWDVMKAGDPIPQDVLQAMAQLGADTRHAQKLWHTREIDINDDGAKELMISNVIEWCGTGGCGAWLWQRDRQGLRNLLPTDDILTVAVEVEITTTGGYHDLRFYHRTSDENNRAILVSDKFVWNGIAYAIHSRKQHGEYLETMLPATSWKVTP